MTDRGLKTTITRWLRENTKFAIVVALVLFVAWLCRFQVIHARAGHSVVVNRFTGEFQVIRSEVRRVMPLE